MGRCLDGHQLEAARFVIRVDDGHAIECDGRAGIEGPLDLVSRAQQLGGRAREPAAFQRTCEVGVGLFVVVLEPAHARAIVVKQDEGIVGQEVEHVRHLVLEQRRKRLAARRQRAAEKRVDQRIDLAGRHALLFGEHAQQITALDHVFAIEEQLARRRRDGPQELRLAALARGIEVADRVDLIAEELDAQRMGALGREEVDDAAARRELARLFDERHAGVARGRELLDEGVVIELLAHREIEGARAKGRARRAAREGTRTASAQ